MPLAIVLVFYLCVTDYHKLSRKAIPICLILSSLSVKVWHGGGLCFGSHWLKSEFQPDWVTFGGPEDDLRLLEDFGSFGLSGFPLFSYGCLQRLLLALVFINSCVWLSSWWGSGKSSPGAQSLTLPLFEPLSTRDSCFLTQPLQCGLETLEVLWRYLLS